MVRSTWERPERGTPTTYRCPNSARSSRAGSCAWASGTSDRAQETGARWAPPGSSGWGRSSISTCRPSAGSQGLGCGTQSASRAASDRASTRALRSVGASSAIGSAGSVSCCPSGVPGRATARPRRCQWSAAPQIRASSAACRSSRARVSADGSATGLRVPAYAVWKGTTVPWPSRARARPGVAGEMLTASLVSMTSMLSEESVTRRAMRRLVLARMSELTTPAGRWVARIRWMPRERPRWAMPTRPGRSRGSPGRGWRTRR